MKIDGGMSVDRVMALRSQILERNQALARANETGAAAGASGAVPAQPTSFADTLNTALKTVNDGQNQASALSESYERGETVEIGRAHV